jgi:hypothetical protein
MADTPERKQGGDALATLARDYVRLLQQRAKARGLPCTLQPAELVSMLRETTVCPVLGIALQPGRVRGPHIVDATTTIVMLDPGQGYTRDNVAVISHRANRLLADATLAEMQAIVKWMKRPH